MPHLPALITSGDVMPGGGDLIGRRWAGHQLLRAWARFAGESPLALAHADPQSLFGLRPWLDESGFKGQLKTIGLVHPQPFREWGGLFLPDPSIGRWAQWRQTAGADSFIDRSDPYNFDANDPALFKNYSRNLFSPGCLGLQQFG